MEPTGSPAAPGPGTGPVPPTGPPRAPGAPGTTGADRPPAASSAAGGDAPSSAVGTSAAATSVPPLGPTSGPGPSIGAEARSITGSTATGLTGGDWPSQATNAIVDVVGTVRDKTTGPVTTVARGAVFGLFAAVLAAIIGVLAIIAVIRLLDEALPSGVWLPYLILGALFVVAGALVFRKRKAPAPSA